VRTKIVAATAALLLLGSAAAYAYVAVTATATLTVNEALYIDVALVDVGLTGTPTRTFCTLSADKANATCAADVYPGESGQVGVTINNRSTAALTTTETAVSSSSDVTLTINTPTASVPGNGSKFFATLFAVSQSASPGHVTINLSFSR